MLHLCCGASPGLAVTYLRARIGFVHGSSGSRGVEAEDERALMGSAEVRGGRVLVVDDDPDVREAVETALELEGHSVTTAA